MTKTKQAEHTPGPWEANGGTIVARNLSWPEGYAPIAETYGYWFPDDEKANARLIAAAPESPHQCSNADCIGGQRWQALQDLLAAAEAALPHLHWADCHGSRCPEAIEQIRAAIAKAKGVV
jgi:hypothetical protein